MRLKEFMQPGGLINNPSKVQAIINKYGKNKSALKASDYIEVSQKTGVPIDLLLAQGAAESNFGIYGRAVRTKNVGNVGNTDSGSAEYRNSWKDGLYRQANLLKNEYNVTSQQDVQRMLDTRFARPSGGNYATDPNYSMKVGQILNEISDEKFNINSSQSYTQQGPTNNQQPLLDMSQYSKMMENMKQGVWDWSDSETMEFAQKAPGIADMMFKQTQSSQESAQNQKLTNEREMQEQKKKEIEYENQQLQSALVLKQQEREQVLAMIPQATAITKTSAPQLSLGV